MQLNSLIFLLFITISFLVYAHIPLKVRRIWLLIVSYCFYASFGIIFLPFLVLVTLFTYVLGLLVEYKGKYANIWLSIGALGGLGLLVYYKYSNLLIQTINVPLSIFKIDNIHLLNIIAPVGISFYMLQVIGYLFDVKRGKIKVEKNVIDYALFVAFFPQISAGPIGRAPELLPQIKSLNHLEVPEIKEGLFSIAYGLFMKIVVADTIGLVIDPIFAQWEDKLGMELLAAIILFGIQIYGDFCGYTLMAIGCGRLFGIRLKDNFKHPYLVTSIKEFWRKWHISLTSWFTDYIYIPLGGNRKGVVRQFINILIVFLCSGLWHGAGWNFLVWGFLNGLLLIVEQLLNKPCGSLCDRFKVDRTARIYKIFKALVVFCAIDFAWLFFRVESIHVAIEMIMKMISQFRLSWFFSASFFNIFGSSYQLGIISISIMIILLVGIYEVKNNESISKLVFRQQIVFRWIIYFALLMVILFWGAYGNDYEQTQFIYFQF